MKSGNWAFLTLLSIHPEKGYVTPLYRVDTEEEGWFAEPDWDRFFLLDDDASGMNMHDGWIYYRNLFDDNRIYRMRPDGSESSRLNEDRSWYVSLVNNWIFYINQDDGDRIYKMRIDGSEIKPLSDDRFSTLNLTYEWIYFGLMEGKGIGRMRHDGSGYEQMY